MGMNTEWVEAWMNLLQVNQVVESSVEQRLQEQEDLSVAEFEILARICATPRHQLKMVDIAHLQLLSKSGVTRIIDRLEEAGLVEREVPPENRRIVYARMTPAGVEAFRRARGVFNDAIEDNFSRHLSDGEVQDLRQVLRKLLVATGVWEDDRCTLKLEVAPAATARERQA